MADRAGRTWGAGVAGALVVHAAMVLAVVLTVKIASPPKEPPAFVVRLIQPWRPPHKPERQPPPRTAAAHASPLPAPVPAVLSAPPSTMPVGPASPPAQDAQAGLRSILRGSVGCADMDRFHLSPEERARCAKLMQAHLDPTLQIQAAIDPAKRAWYDATVRAHQLNTRMPMGPPGLGHSAVTVAGVGGATSGAVAPHDVKIGPLHLGLPPGAFNDDDPPFPGR